MVEGALGAVRALVAAGAGFFFTGDLLAIVMTFANRKVMRA